MNKIKKKKWTLIMCSLLITTILSVLSCSSLKKAQDINLIQYDSITHKNVYIFVEIMPQYKGGNRAFMNEFSKKFHYEDNKHEGIQTKLRVQFVIDKKGSLTGARIYNKKYEEITNFEKAGLKAIASMQNWESGKHKNKNVNVLITMSIDIDIQHPNN